MGSRRILLIDDHAVLSRSLALALAAEGFSVERPADLNADTVLETARRWRPDVALLDLMLGEVSSTPLIAPLAARGARVVILTGVTDPYTLAECLEVGAAGLFNKAQPFEDLLHVVRAACAGRPIMDEATRASMVSALRGRRQAQARDLARFERLSRRERAVLKGIIEGKSAAAIATEQFVSIGTVRTQIRSILRKLEASSQLEAVAYARQAGWPT